MKTKLVTLMGCLVLIFSGSSFAACGGNTCAVDQEDMGASYCQEASAQCACSDPECKYGNPCLSPARCCAAWGNPGGWTAADEM